MCLAKLCHIIRHQNCLEFDIKRFAFIATGGSNNAQTGEVYSGALSTASPHFTVYRNIVSVAEMHCGDCACLAQAWLSCLQCSPFIVHNSPIETHATLMYNK